MYKRVICAAMRNTTHFPFFGKEVKHRRLLAPLLKQGTCRKGIKEPTIAVERKDSRSIGVVVVVGTKR